MYKVSILLLNYNGKSFNKDCIDSILKQSYKDFEIIFIDNNSTDGSLEDVERIFSREIKLGIIKVVKNKENLWFAGGNNSGIPFISKVSKYVRLLNNDTVIDKDCLQELIKGIESDNQLGAVSSLILDRGIEDEIKEKTKQGEVRITNVFGLQIREKAKINNDILYTNFLCGCSFLYKKSIVDKPFFDFYNAYAEDLELSREFILKGYKLGICKKAIVNHFGSGTMNKNPKYLKLYYDNRNVFINYKTFFSRKTRLKLFVPFLFFHFLQIVNSFGTIKLIKAKWNAFKRVRENSDCVNIVKNRINQGRKLSEQDFLKTMSCKMACDDFNSGKLKIFFINVINIINKIFFKILSINYYFHRDDTKNNQ